MSRAKARFFGFAKIVTERVFFCNDYFGSIMMTKNVGCLPVNVVTSNELQVTSRAHTLSPSCNNDFVVRNGMERRELCERSGME